MQKFIVLFVGRCGGTWLASMLRSTPSIYMQNEVFGGVCRNLTGKNDVVPIAESEEERVRFQTLQRNFLERATTNKKNKFFKDTEPTGQEIAAGFLMKYRQMLDPQGFTNFVLETDCKIIYLKRENVVQQAVSYFGGFEAKKINGSYNVVGNAKSVNSFEVDPQSLLEKTEEFALDNKVFEEYLAEQNFGEHWVTYEDLVADTTGEMNKILDHINVPRQKEFTTTVKKNLKGQLSDSLVNYEDCVSKFTGTPYEGFIAGKNL